MRIRKHIAAACFAVAIIFATFTAYADVKKLPIDISGGMPYSLENCISENVYEDESIRVEISSVQVDKTLVHIAKIRIDDPSQLRTAPAYSFDRDQTAPTTAIAERVHAVLAVNGDYYSYQAARGGYMIRQGKQYINKPIKGRDVLIIDGNGDFHIEFEINEEVLDKYDELGGIINSFNFGPGLVVDGEVQAKFDGEYNMGREKAARACIGQIKRGELEYMCVVSEGTDDSRGGGMTLEMFSDFVSTLGMENVYNLDGGNSSALIYLGKKINAAQNHRHRPLSDIIYFATTVSE